MQIHIIDIPPAFPKGWDLADNFPEGITAKSLLEQCNHEVKTLSDLVFTAKELAVMDVPPRTYLVEPFIVKPSMNMVYSKRGLGKTWFTLLMSTAIARGHNFLCYEVPEPRPVLFIDGEMALVDLVSRFRSIGVDDLETLHILPSELIYKEDTPINIFDIESQERIAKVLNDLKKRNVEIDMIVFDNVSSLSAGVDENDNAEQEMLLQWLIHLRHEGYAILLVHHAGKSGDQRGASRREDFMDTVIKLEAVEVEDGDNHFERGAKFLLTFSKTRGEQPVPHELELTLMSNADGHLEFSFVDSGKATQYMKALRFIDRKKPQTQKELAALLNMSEASISNYAKELRKRGYLEKQGLVITNEGYQELSFIWPQEYQGRSEPVQEEIDIE